MCACFLHYQPSGPGTRPPRPQRRPTSEWRLPGAHCLLHAQRRPCRRKRPRVGKARLTWRRRARTKRSTRARQALVWVRRRSPSPSCPGRARLTKKLAAAARARPRNTGAAPCLQVEGRRFVHVPGKMLEKYSNEIFDCVGQTSEISDFFVQYGSVVPYLHLGAKSGILTVGWFKSSWRPALGAPGPQVGQPDASKRQEAWRLSLDG
jgi:hypothetical protein